MSHYFRPQRRSGHESWLISYADLITNLLIFFILIISASQIQTGKMEKIIANISQNKPTKSLTSAEKELKEELERQKLTENVSVRMTDDGLELSFDSGVTFASGSAALLPQMEDPMAKVLTVLVPYVEKYDFAVEGHTDENPIASAKFKSNWELSSERAMQVRERLERVGVPHKQIRVEAYADTKPLPGDQVQGLDREALLAKHRRVVVRLH